MDDIEKVPLEAATLAQLFDMKGQNAEMAE